MASSLAKPVSHHRQSNSASSSSIITVQRAASLSPRSSTRPNASTLRSQSPNESRLAPTNLSVRTLSPDARRRSSAICSRPDSGHGVREGIGNLNRWSQSTASSKSSASHNRRGSFSKRISGTFSSFGGFASPQMSPNVLTKPRPVIKEGASDIPGPSGQSSPVHSPPKLPFLVTTLAPSYGAGVSHTPSTAATITPTNTDLLSTSTSTSGEPDYFGEKWTVVPTSKHRPGKTQSIAVSSFATKPFSQTYVAQSSSSESSWRPIPVDSVSSLYSSTRSSLRPNNSERYHFSHHRPSRNRGDPHKTSAGTEGESSASSVQSSRARIPRRKTPSQKAMLSKALQKANHAVLLDNAQNFEGAMDAYADACILLQQVMSRSSTDEDRRKLEAVVSKAK